MSPSQSHSSALRYYANFLVFGLQQTRIKQYVIVMCIRFVDWPAHVRMKWIDLENLETKALSPAQSFDLDSVALELKLSFCWWRSNGRAWGSLLIFKIYYDKLNGWLLLNFDLVWPFSERIALTMVMLCRRRWWWVDAENDIQVLIVCARVDDRSSKAEDVVSVWAWAALVGEDDETMRSILNCAFAFCAWEITNCNSVLYYMPARRTTLPASSHLSTIQSTVTPIHSIEIQSQVHSPNIRHKFPINAINCSSVLNAHLLRMHKNERAFEHMHTTDYTTQNANSPNHQKWILDIEPSFILLNVNSRATCTRIPFRYSIFASMPSK